MALAPQASIVKQQTAQALGNSGQLALPPPVPGQYGGLVPLQTAPASALGGTSAEMQVEQALVGYLIGKGGESLKAMQSASGATLHVDQTSKDQGLSIIRITGSEQAVTLAKTLVDRKISEVKVPAVVADSGAANTVAYEYHIDQSYVGFFIGRGGEQVKRIKAQTGATVVIDQSTKDFGYSVVRIMVGPGVEAAKTHIENRLEQAKEATLQNMAPGTAEEMVIPQQLVGWVIGRSGESLRQIKQASGATLVLNQDTKAQGYSIVRFAGEADAVAKAKDFIKRKLGEVEGKTLPSQPFTAAAGSPVIQSLPSAVPAPSNPNVTGNTQATTAAIQAIASLLSMSAGQRPPVGATGLGCVGNGGLATASSASGAGTGGYPGLTHMGGSRQVAGSSSSVAACGQNPFSQARPPPPLPMSSRPQLRAPAPLAAGQGLHQYMGGSTAPTAGLQHQPLVNTAVYDPLASFTPPNMQGGTHSVQVSQAHNVPMGLDPVVPLPGATTIVRPSMGGGLLNPGPLPTYASSTLPLLSGMIVPPPPAGLTATPP